MIHGDNKGVIIPPWVSPIQIVIIPIIYNKSKDQVLNYITQIQKIISPYFRIEVDYSNYNPGWKYNHWEKMGVPLKMEIGPRDQKNKTVIVCRRDTLEKIKIEINFDAESNLIDQLTNILKQIHQNLYETAKRKLYENVSRPKNWSEFKTNLEDKKICLIKWCGKTECEEIIKEKTTAKSLCIPDHADFILEIESDSQCIKCGSQAKTSCLFGRSY